MLEQRYLDWIFEIIGGKYEYEYLIRYLYEIPFHYTLEMDSNRAEDGKSLRYRFGWYNDISNNVIEEELHRFNSSILEMMVALAIRCENGIMSDPEVGDRTSDWFWGMIDSLGLSSMTDDNFDIRVADDIISKFEKRQYKKNGEGGLFTIKDTTKDMRTAEIWYQMCWYLDKIIYG